MKIPKPYIYLEIGRRLTHGHDVGWEEGVWSDNAGELPATDKIYLQNV